MSFHATFPSVLVGIGLLVLPHAKMRSATFFRQDVAHLIEVRMCSPHHVNVSQRTKQEPNERNGNRRSELGTKPNGNPKTPNGNTKAPQSPDGNSQSPTGGRIQFHPKQFHRKYIWRRERGSGALCKQVLNAFFLLLSSSVWRRRGGARTILCASWAAGRRQ